MVEQMKKVIITGARGQLGHALIKALSPYFVIHAFGSTELDVTRQDDVRRTFYEIQPDIVIHAAAYTAVDEAEKDDTLAKLVNVTGTKHVAMACAEINAVCCYISTDYVFDGLAVRPYVEDDETHPINKYGLTKREGELMVESLCAKYYIVRTSWLYGLNGNNFVKTMLRLASVQASSKMKSDRLMAKVSSAGQSVPAPLRVVDDQLGSPTYALDLAHFIRELLTTTHYGIYHASNAGACTWFEFAQAIFEEANLAQKVLPCTTDEFPRPAPRPQYSVLSNKKIQDSGLTALRPWREALRSFFKELQQTQ